MSAPDRVQVVPVLQPGGLRVMGELRIWEEAPDNQDAVRLELRFDDQELGVTTEDGFFAALAALRKELESEGSLLACYGCSRNVYPSPMIRSMGQGEKAYLLKMGQPARSEDLVSIFETGAEVEPVTVAEQEKYYRDWLSSLG